VSKERAKGTAFETAVARFLHGTRTGSASAHMGDILLPYAPYLTIECKATQRIDLPGAMRQAEKAAGTQRVPIVIHKRVGRPVADSYVTIDLDYFRALIHEWNDRDSSI
jgi:hypothetical protein